MLLSNCLTICLIGDEDCLYLNVFTRHPGNPDAKKQVLVWVHGGAFIFGGAKLYPAGKT